MPSSFSSSDCAPHPCAAMRAAMPAWLGWIAVVLLSLFLAVYPALAAGLAWRFGPGDVVRFGLVFEASLLLAQLLRAALFTGFSWNPLRALWVPPLPRGP